MQCSVEGTLPAADMNLKKKKKKRSFLLPIRNILTSYKKLVLLIANNYMLLTIKENFLKGNY